MGKLCAKEKPPQKRKFKVYPSAYANMYASAVCSGKVTPGGKKKAKKKSYGWSVNEIISQSKKTSLQSYGERADQDCCCRMWHG